MWYFYFCLLYTIVIFILIIIITIIIIIIIESDFLFIFANKIIAVSKAGPRSIALSFPRRHPWGSTCRIVAFFSSSYFHKECWYRLQIHLFKIIAINILIDFSWISILDVWELYTWRDCRCHTPRIRQDVAWNRGACCPCLHLWAYPPFSSGSL